MELPLWVEELRERYLADAGNAFLLHGATAGPIWEVDGHTLDCEHVLRRFLHRTRPIVGILRPTPLPSRLEFADMSDRARFENLIKAYDLLVGRAFPQQENAPPLALARIWRALSTTGTDQAYLMMDADKLLPSHRRHLPPVPEAPPLVEWPTQERLRRSNNLLLFLTPTLERVRAELCETCVVIEVTDERRPSPPTPTPTTPEPTTPTPGADRGQIRAALAPELRAAFERHPADRHASLLPVFDAVTRVVHAVRPDIALPTLSLDEEGSLVAEGLDGGRLLAAWRADIALDAAATMLVRSYAAGAVIDETAVAALAKRVGRLVDRLETGR